MEGIVNDHAAKSTSCYNALPSNHLFVKVLLKTTIVAQLYSFFYTTLAFAWTCHALGPTALGLSMISDFISFIHEFSQLFIEYEEGYGLVAKTPLKIANHYLISRVGMLRLACAIPWELIALLQAAQNGLVCQDAAQKFLNNQSEGLLDLYKIWAIVRFLRSPLLFVVLFEYVNNVRFKIVSHQINRLVKNLLLFLICAHLDACIFWNVSTLTGSTNSYVLSQGLIFANGTADAIDVGTQYLSSLVLAEKALLYSVIEMLVAALIYGSIFGNIANIVRHLDSEQATIDRVKFHDFKIEKIRSYMATKAFPPVLQDKIVAYMSHRFVKTQGIDEHCIFDDIPSSLRQDISNFLYLDMIKKVSFLQGADNAFLYSIANSVKPLTVLKGCFIFHKDEIAQEMFFIRTGSVAIVNLAGELLVTLKAGAYFGEIAIIEGCKRTASAKAAEDTELCYLRKSDFASLLDEESQARLLVAIAIIKERDRLKNQKAPPPNDLVVPQILIPQEDEPILVPQENIPVILPPRGSVSGLLSTQGSIHRLLTPRSSIQRIMIPQGSIPLILIPEGDKASGDFGPLKNSGLQARKSSIAIKTKSDSSESIGSQLMARRASIRTVTLSQEDHPASVIVVSESEPSVSRESDKKLSDSMNHSSRPSLVSPGSRVSASASVSLQGDFSSVDDTTLELIQNQKNVEQFVPNEVVEAYLQSSTECSGITGPSVIAPVLNSIKAPRGKRGNTTGLIPDDPRKSKKPVILEIISNFKTLVVGGKSSFLNSAIIEVETDRAGPAYRRASFSGTGAQSTQKRRPTAPLTDNVWEDDKPATPRKSTSLARNFNKASNNKEKCKLYDPAIFSLPLINNSESPSMDCVNIIDSSVGSEQGSSFDVGVNVPSLSSSQQNSNLSFRRNSKVEADIKRRMPNLSKGDLSAGSMDFSGLQSNSGAGMNQNAVNLKLQMMKKELELLDLRREIYSNQRIVLSKRPDC